MDTTPSFGSVLKRLRLAAGMTHESLAERAGIGARTISDLERGISKSPRADTLSFIVEALRLSPEHQTLLEESARQGTTSNWRASAVPSNLPFLLTSFIGRESETRSLVELLSQKQRLVTLTGPGGVGKSRLALHVGQAMTAAVDGGVFVIDLIPLRDKEGILQSVQLALGLESVNSGVLQRLIDYMSRKQILLIFDNFEHLLAAATLVSDLLRACPRLRVITTSRAALRLSGEQEFPVPPLPVPDLVDLPALSKIAEYPSIALFADRARRVSPSFELTSENASQIAAICIRLDGLPLALELAAARTKTTSPDDLLKRLRSAAVAPALHVLGDGPRDAPDRQRTLRDTIAWSHDLLSPEEKMLFRRLAVFVGGGTYQAIAEICGESATIGEASVTRECDEKGTLKTASVEQLLTSLIEQNLVFQTDAASGAKRFQMLETIGEYAAEKLLDSGEDAAVRSRHAQYFLKVVESTGALLFAGEQKRMNVAVEQGNLRAALNWLVLQG